MTLEYNFARASVALNNAVPLSRPSFKTKLARATINFSFWYTPAIVCLNFLSLNKLVPQKKTSDWCLMIRNMIVMWLSSMRDHHIHFKKLSTFYSGFYLNTQRQQTRIFLHIFNDKDKNIEIHNNAYNICLQLHVTHDYLPEALSSC